MENQVTTFIDMLSNNNLVAKHYKEPVDLDETFKSSDHEYIVDTESDVDEYSVERFKEYIENERLFPVFLRYFELNGYRKPNELDDFINSGLEAFKLAFASNNLWNDKNLKNDLLKKIKEARVELDDLIVKGKILEDDTLISLLKVKNEYCFEAQIFINNPIVVNNIQDAVKPVKPERTQKPFQKLTKLSQNQVVILFHYLREMEIIGKEMPKNLYAHNIAELTGFTSEKIRQDLSHISKESDSFESQRFSQLDYSAVWRSLDNVINEIKKDSAEKFSPKP